MGFAPEFGEPTVRLSGSDDDDARISTSKAQVGRCSLCDCAHNPKRKSCYGDDPQFACVPTECPHSLEVHLRRRRCLAATCMGGCPQRRQKCRPDHRRSSPCPQFFSLYAVIPAFAISMTFAMASLPLFRKPTIAPIGVNTRVFSSFLQGGREGSMGRTVTLLIQPGRASWATSLGSMGDF